MCRGDAQVLWVLWQVCLARHSSRRLGGQLGTEDVKTKVHVIGHEVWPLYC
jgi:hypothetical protein